MRSDWTIAERLDQLLVGVAEKVRPLPSLAAHDVADQRGERVRELARGQVPRPLKVPARGRVEPSTYRLLDEARKLSEQCHFGELYRDRLEELELDLAILDAWGDAKRVRPLSARRYGRGDELVQAASGELELSALALQLLRSLAPEQPMARSVPPVGERGELSVELLVQRAAVGVGLDPVVRVEPRLSSLAATGERTVFLSPRMFTLREARRLVAHEVFGHLVVAANARAQPLRLLQVGLAGSFADQEGLCLYLEAALGLMCSDRLRTLAGRVVATQLLHAGASFGETAHTLHREHGFSPETAVLTSERTFRGGGVARDSGYLAGFLRVRAAILGGDCTLDELRRGRVALRHVAGLRSLEQEGFVRAACYRPSLALSRTLTFGGTSSDTSPPSDAASLTMFELT